MKKKIRKHRCKNCHDLFMPETIRSFIQNKEPTFVFKYSKTVERKYFANTCPVCKILYGDFHLNGEPGVPFSPMDKEQAKSLYIKKIPLIEPVKIKGARVLEQVK